MDLYRKLLKKKHLKAAINLGVLSELSENFADAEKAYNIAADEGDPDAQYRMGFILDRKDNDE